MRQRRKKSSPYIIGLTGSIGMGKTTIAKMFAKQGAAVCDSDAIVHRLLGKNGKAVEGVARYFPDTLSKNAIDRNALGQQVFADRDKLKELEMILHPLVQVEQQQFIDRMKRKGKKVIVLDIPLLFETGAEKRCHSVVVVSAPLFIQKQRVMKRAGMTKEKVTSILARQMPDKQKCKHADVIIDTGLGKARSYQQAAKMLQKVLCQTKNTA